LHRYSAVCAAAKKGDKYGPYELDYADDFEYTDPIDGRGSSLAHNRPRV
jgi:hypothetical protein